MTPGGNPAASNSCMIWCAAKAWFSAAFHTTVFPRSAGALGRFPAMAVKLKGVTAKTNPSSGRSSRVLAVPAGEKGCSVSWLAKWTLKRRKSTSSQAESISAWYEVLLCPSMVAALSVARNGPASISAARRKMRARSSNGIAAHPGAAFRAAAMAFSVTSVVAARARPSTRRWSCGAHTSKVVPSCEAFPSMWCGSSIG